MRIDLNRTSKDLSHEASREGFSAIRCAPSPDIIDYKDDAGHHGDNGVIHEIVWVAKEMGKTDLDQSTLDLSMMRCRWIPLSIL